MDRTVTRRRLVGVPLGSLGAALMALLLTASTTLGAVGWTSPVGFGRSYSFNFGGGLARTVSGTTGYLHTQMGTDYVGGAFADDNGPYAGVYYRRGSGSGTTWGTSKRMNPSTKHAYQGGIAASGSRVYVAWMTVGHLVAYDPAEPRTLGFRANDRHGSATAWRSSIALTTAGRINNPNIAAAGSYVHIVYTDSDTGDIVLWSSPDYGVTWASKVVGTTTDTSGENGFAGWPELAASGGTVAVTWIDSQEPQFAVSTDNGATFTPPASIGVGPAFELAIAARGDRIAVAVASEAGSRVKLWKAGSWIRERSFASHDPSGTTTYKAAYGPAVVLAGTSTVAVAWSACRRTANCTASSTYGVDLRWRESTNNLVSFKSPLTIASWSASTAKRINDSPSVLMTSTTRRIVTYNTSSANGYSKYRLYIEVGKGTP